MVLIHVFDIVGILVHLVEFLSAYLLIGLLLQFLLYLFCLLFLRLQLDIVFIGFRVCHCLFDVETEVRFGQIEHRPIGVNLRLQGVPPLLEIIFQVRLIEAR